jgi:hypothetical protein
MIKNNAQAVIEDVLGGDVVTFDVNFSDEHKDCVKITIAGYSSIVKYTDLFSFMFSIATKEQQAKMMPVREELGHQYMKQIQVKLKKDMKEGEMMVVNVPINVPQIIEDSILSAKELSTPTPYLKE